MDNKELIIDKHVTCTCDIGYKSRLLPDPDCPRCSYGGEISDAMDEYVAGLLKENEELKNENEGYKEIREGLEILLDACKSANEAKEKEIERLKGLIEDAYIEGCNYKTTGVSWQQFKTENNL